MGQQFLGKSFVAEARNQPRAKHAWIKLTGDRPHCVNFCLTMSRFRATIYIVSVVAAQSPIAVDSYATVHRDTLRPTVCCVF